MNLADNQPKEHNASRKLPQNPSKPTQTASDQLKALSKNGVLRPYPKSPPEIKRIYEEAAGYLPGDEKQPNEVSLNNLLDLIFAKIEGHQSPKDYYEKTH